MGLDTNGCRILLLAKSKGISFNRILTLGRLNLSLSRPMMTRCLMEFGLYNGEDQIQRMFSDPGGFCEPFLKELGATHIDSLDATAYEGATIIQDLNEAPPHHLHQNYDVVIDGGTLEHVFNFPVAVRGAMECVKIGGRLISFTQCNNAMGHGFYQFSPELFFRILSPQNGFHMDQMILAEGSFGKVPWQIVSDPNDIKRRVELVNDVQSYLLISAKRTSDAPVFQSWPQQSDYAQAWQDSSPDLEFAKITSRSSDFRDTAPQILKRALRIFRLVTKPRFVEPFYQAARPTQLFKNL